MNAENETTKNRVQSDDGPGFVQKLATWAGLALLPLLILACLSTGKVGGSHMATTSREKDPEVFWISIVFAALVFGVGAYGLVFASPSAKKEKEPNQPPEPTAPSGRGSS